MNGQWRQKGLGRVLGAGMGRGFTAGQRPGGGRPEVWGLRWLMRPPCRDVLLSFW